MSSLNASACFQGTFHPFCLFFCFIFPPHPSTSTFSPFLFALLLFTPVSFLILPSFLPPLSFAYLHPLPPHDAVPLCVSSLPSILPFFWKRGRGGVCWRGEGRGEGWRGGEGGGLGLYKSCSLQPPRSCRHHAETDRRTETLTQHPHALVGPGHEPIASA